MWQSLPFTAINHLNSYLALRLWSWNLVGLTHTHTKTKLLIVTADDTISNEVGVALKGWSIKLDKRYLSDFTDKKQFTHNATRKNSTKWNSEKRLSLQETTKTHSKQNEIPTCNHAWLMSLQVTEIHQNFSCKLAHLIPRLHTTYPVDHRVVQAPSGPAELHPSPTLCT